MAPLNVERRGLIGRQVGLNMAPWACRAMDTSSIFFTSRARTTLKGALQCMMRLFARIEVYVPERDSGTNFFHGVGRFLGFRMYRPASATQFFTFFGTGQRSAMPESK